MPYIEKMGRSALDRGSKQPGTSGELTYKLYRESLEYSKRKGKSFSTYCEVMGSLVCTALEFYRRVVAEHEEVKRKLNGDVE